MIDLYHFGFSTCSQKVRMVLAEKGLDFTSHEIDLLSGAQHDPAYVALNPNHVVPTLVDGGRVFLESTLINEYLDEAYPERPLMPESAADRHAARMWTKLLDQRVHPATGTVTFALGPRNMILQQPKEVRESNIEAIPDPEARKRRRSVIEHGVDAPEFAAALAAMVELLDRAEKALADQTWLTGSNFGLADAAIIPYVLRLDHLAMQPLLGPTVRPRLSDWYQRTQLRPSFQLAIAEWAPAEVIDLMRAQGEPEWPKIERILAGAEG